MNYKSSANHKALLIAAFCIIFPAYSELNIVSVVGNRIEVNTKPFYIKGICYHPVSKGKKGTQRSFEYLEKDLELMIEAGINTIRVYKPIDNLKVLDAINKAGIKLITSFGYDQKGFYDIKSGTFINYINKYKNHPAILIWELGNEYNYHPEWFDGDITVWYKEMNAAANSIHENDLNHPVSTSHGEIPDQVALEMSSNIDIWGFNVYRWDEPETFLKEWYEVSSKPMYFSEVGADSYMTIDKNGFKKGDNQKAQAAANEAILEKILLNAGQNLGVLLFAFNDSWWKAGNPSSQDPGGWAPNSSGVPYDGTANEEYWGIVDIDRNKKLSFDVVKHNYNNFILENNK